MCGVADPGNWKRWYAACAMVAQYCTEPGARVSRSWRRVGQAFARLLPACVMTGSACARVCGVNVRGSDNKAAIVAAGGIERVVMGMAGHARSGSIQEYGCATLSRLADASGGAWRA